MDIYERMTDRSRKVIDLSLREALQLGHNYIGTEHLLLALVREGEGIGSQVLEDLGCDLNRVRQAVIKKLSGYESTVGGWERRLANLEARVEDLEKGRG
jgi:ATP-dependent Clp protease ATP-binding subunit ClpC